VDLSYTQVFADKFTIEVTGFYTLFRNAIVKAPYQLNGQDSVIYNGVNSQVLASQNLNKANLYGINAAINFAFTSYLSLSSAINYTKGEFEIDPAKTTSVLPKSSLMELINLVQANVTSKPLDHIPPVFGKTSLLLNQEKWNAEFYALYNGWKKLDQYNPDGEDNAQYATADGMPSWFTLNARASYTFVQKVQLQLAVENILDRNYRYFASGFSAPAVTSLLL
jgi:hemoglobin/transferrin/lactoferrin receptor protein